MVDFFTGKQRLFIIEFAHATCNGLFLKSRILKIKIFCIYNICIYNTHRFVLVMKPEGKHPFSFRTRPLRLPGAMVLLMRESSSSPVQRGVEHRNKIKSAILMTLFVGV